MWYRWTRCKCNLLHIKCVYYVGNTKSFDICAMCCWNQCMQFGTSIRICREFLFVCIWDCCKWNHCTRSCVWPSYVFTHFVDRFVIECIYSHVTCTKFKEMKSILFSLFVVAVHTTISYEWSTVILSHEYPKKHVNKPLSSFKRCFGWSISPSLPDGLSINRETGIISGSLPILGDVSSEWYTIHATCSHGDEEGHLFIVIDNVVPDSWKGMPKRK